MKVAERISAGRRFMATLAALDGRLARLRQEEAEVLAERAKLFAEQAGAEHPVDLRTGKRLRQVPAPVQLVPPSDIDKARAERALQRNATRRRSSR